MRPVWLLACSLLGLPLRSEVPQVPPTGQTVEVESYRVRLLAPPDSPWKAPGDLQGVLLQGLGDLNSLWQSEAQLRRLITEGQAEFQRHPEAGLVPDTEAAKRRLARIRELLLWDGLRPLEKNLAVAVQEGVQQAEGRIETLRKDSLAMATLAWSEHRPLPQRGEVAYSALANPALRTLLSKVEALSAPRGEGLSAEERVGLARGIQIDYLDLLKAFEDPLQAWAAEPLAAKACDAWAALGPAMEAHVREVADVLLDADRGRWTRAERHAAYVLEMRTLQACRRVLGESTEVWLLMGALGPRVGRYHAVAPGLKQADHDEQWARIKSWEGMKSLFMADRQH